jgi:glycosyltransferase involved in cell wall biosynthesis
MDHKKYFVFISTASLLHFRGVEHWLIEVATRLKGSVILTFSTGLKSIDNVKARVALAKSRLGNNEWHEIRAISHEHAGKGVPSFITRFMKHSGIVIPINLKIIKLLRGKLAYLVIGDAYQAMLLTAAAAISGARKVILGLHSRPSYKRFILIKPLLALMNRTGLVKGIHAVNIVDALMLRRILSNIPVWWIPNGVDCRRFKPGAKRGDVFQALFVGALSDDKGVDTFIEAARIVKRYYNDVRFVITSSGGPLKSIVEKAHKDGVVKFIGFVPDSELPKLYAESHVAVFPSRDDTFPLVSLEAQASGTPVIATDLPAFRQSVIDGITGILVRPYSPQAFANAIIKMRELWLNNRQEYERMGISARRNAERFCWERVVKIYYKKFFKQS